VMREENQVNEIKGMKGQSGGKKVNQFLEM